MMSPIQKIRLAAALAIVPCAAFSRAEQTVRETRGPGSSRAESVRAFINNPSMDNATVRAEVDAAFQGGDRETIALVNAQIQESLDFDPAAHEAAGGNGREQLERHLRILEAFSGSDTFQRSGALATSLARMNEKILSLKEASRLGAGVENGAKRTARALIDTEKRPLLTDEAQGAAVRARAESIVPSRTGDGELKPAEPDEQDLSPAVPAPIERAQAAPAPQVRRAKAPRDYRVDFLRGTALVMIFIDHMPGNRLSHWTLGNFGLSDAAELFVLLAGFAAAFAYFAKYERGDRRDAIVKALRRAWTLYTSHLGATAAALALLAGAYGLAIADIDFLDGMGALSIWKHPESAILRVFAGIHQLSYFNILPMYVVLLLMLPGMLWLAARSQGALLGASFAVYLAAQFLPLPMLYPTSSFGWFFNPLAWQMLFAIGISLGIAKLRGASAPRNRALHLAALAYVIFGALWALAGLGQSLIPGLPKFIGSIDKTNLSLPRLLNILALAYVLVYSPAWSWLARLSKNNLFTRMGRNSLPVFCVGSLLSMAGWMLQMRIGSSWLFELSYAAFGTSLMMFWAWILEKRQTVRAAVAGVAGK